MADFRHRITIHGEDRASGALKAVGESSQGMGRRIADATATISHAINIAKAFAAAAQAMANAMAKPIELAGQQEQAVVRLNAAMRTSGQFTAAASRALQQNAAALQKVTRYGDEAIMPVQALLLQFGGLATDQVPRATKAVIDFAEANGTDLKGAAQLVAKAIGTSTNALSRYGIEIDNSLRGAERFEAILGQIEEKVGGTAQAMGGTFLGKLQMVSNAWGDLLEKVGDFVIKNEAVRAVLDGVISLFETWSSQLSESSEGAAELDEAITNFVQQQLPAFIDGIAYAVEGVGALTAAILEGGVVAKATFGLLSALPGPLGKLYFDAAVAANDYSDEMGGIKNSGKAAAAAIREFADELRAGNFRKRAEEFAYLDDFVQKTEKSTSKLATTSKSYGMEFGSMVASVRPKLSPWAAEIDQLQQSLKRSVAQMGFGTAGARHYQKAQDRLNEDFREGRKGADAFLESLRKIASQAEQTAARLKGTGESAQVAMPGSYSTPGAAKIAGDPADASAVWATAFMEATAANLEAEADALDEFWESAMASGAEITAAGMAAISDAIVDHSQSWDESFTEFGESIKATMTDALLEPILGAESALAEFAGALMAPFRALGQAINQIFFQPLVDAILNFFGIKAMLEEADLKRQQAAAIRLAAATIGVHAQAMAAMLPPLFTGAAAALVMSFGAAALAAGELPAITATAMGQGAAVAAALSGVSGAAAGAAFADGGQVTSPTVALIGEAGPETIIPESRPARARQLLADLFARNPGLMGGGGQAAVFQNQISVNVVAGTADPRGLAEELADHLNDILGQQMRA